MTKLSDILKEHGLFSKDIKQRISSGQIKINGEPVFENIDLNITEIHDAGEFLFDVLKNDLDRAKILIFGLENWLEDTIFKMIRISRKQAFIVKVE